MSQHRFVTLTTAHPAITVTGLRGEQPPIPEGGYGGWQKTARPRRKSITEWMGIEPLQVQVQIVIGVTPGVDMHSLDRSAEPDREKLERMARPPTAGAEPPIVRVTGAVPHASLDWVIADLEWDTSPLYSNKGFLTRQIVTVHLLEHVAGELLAPASAASTVRATAEKKSANAARAAGVTTNNTTKIKVYIVRAGDTLSKIAAKRLGSYKRWTEIAKLNEIRDPKSIVVGQHLRMP